MRVAPSKKKTARPVFSDTVQGPRKRRLERRGKCPMSDDAARRATSTRRGRRGDASPRRLRPRRVIRTWRARARADRVGVREGEREGERDDAPGSRTALGPSRRASSPRRRPRGACRRRLRRRRRRRGDRRSGRRLRRGDRRSGRRLPAGHRTRLCRSPGLRRSPGRRHFWSRRHGQRLGPTRGRIPSRCRRRRAGEGGDKACEVGVAPRCVRNRCAMRKGEWSRRAKCA